MDSVILLHPTWQAEKNVLIFGGAVALDLRNYIAMIGMPNLGLGCQEYGVHFYTHPHMKLVSDTVRDNMVQHLVPAYHTLVPDKVILIIGNEDLWFKCPSIVAAGVYAVARYLVHAGCKDVVICQLPTHPTAWYRSRLEALENIIVTMLAEDNDNRVAFCAMPGFRTAPAFVLDSEAHLNCLGLYRLYRGVRHCITDH